MSTETPQQEAERLKAEADERAGFTESEGVTTRSVVMLVDDDEAEIAFKGSADEDEASVQLVILSPEIWSELGEPTELTVSIEAGDRLNS